MRWAVARRWSSRASFRPRAFWGCDLVRAVEGVTGRAVRHGHDGRGAVAQLGDETCRWGVQLEEIGVVRQDGARGLPVGRDRIDRGHPVAGDPPDERLAVVRRPDEEGELLLL